MFRIADSLISKNPARSLKRGNCRENMARRTGSFAMHADPSVLFLFSYCQTAVSKQKVSNTKTRNTVTNNGGIIIKTGAVQICCLRHSCLCTGVVLQFCDGMEIWLARRKTERCTYPCANLQCESTCLNTKMPNTVTKHVRLDKKRRC